MRKSARHRDSIAKVLDFYKKMAEGTQRTLEHARVNGAFGKPIFAGVKPPRTYH